VVIMGMGMTMGMTFRRNMRMIMMFMVVRVVMMMLMAGRTAQRVSRTSFFASAMFTHGILIFTIVSMQR
jgi:hypothetical protein